MAGVFAIASILMLCILVAPQSDADASSGAMVDGTGYTSLQDAVKNAEPGSTVVLTSDANITSTLMITKKIVIDLNGHDIKADGHSSNQIYVTESGDLTIKDSMDSNMDGSAGKIYGTHAYVYGTYDKTLIEVHGKFTMASGFISYSLENASDYGMFGIGVWGSGKVIINGGKIETGWYAVAGNGADRAANTEITVNGGYLISTADYSVYNPQNGKVTINGGTVYGAAGAILMNRGILEIHGGLLTSKGIGSTGDWGDGTGGASNAALHLNARYDDVNATIDGGKLTAEGNAVLIDSGSKHTITLKISGGAFSEEPSAEYIASGSIVTKIGDLYYVATEVQPTSPGLVDTEQAEIVTNLGDATDAVVKMPLVEVSLNGDSAIGNILVSATPRTFSEAPDAIASYEITIVSGVSYTADITVAADIARGFVPLVYYIDDDGNLVPVEVVSYTSTTVTFRTTHTTPFVVMTEAEPTVTPGYDDDEDDMPYVPPTVVSNSKNDNTTTIVACAAAAVAAAMIAAFLLIDGRKP